MKGTAGLASVVVDAESMLEALLLPDTAPPAPPAWTTRRSSPATCPSALAPACAPSALGAHAIANLRALYHSAHARWATFWANRPLACCVAAHQSGITRGDRASLCLAQGEPCSCSHRHLQPRTLPPPANPGPRDQATGAAVRSAIRALLEHPQLHKCDAHPLHTASCDHLRIIGVFVTFGASSFTKGPYTTGKVRAIHS
jgi:hypothetical protein